MAKAFSQIHIHVIIAVKFRQALIMPHWEQELYKYITGIVRSNGHKLLQINGMPDHVHILIGMRPTQSLSDLMKLVKMQSSFWINENKKSKYRFQWQPGYGAFSLSRSDIGRVANYIQRQKIHHQKKSFTDEFTGTLVEYGVNFEKKYIFSDPVNS